MTIKEWASFILSGSNAHLFHPTLSINQINIFISLVDLKAEKQLSAYMISN